MGRKAKPATPNTQTKKVDNEEQEQQDEEALNEEEVVDDVDDADEEFEKSSIILEWNYTLKKFDDLSKSVLAKTMRSLKLKNLQIVQLRNKNKSLIVQNTVKKKKI